VGKCQTVARSFHSHATGYNTNKWHTRIKR
jgi:hypothetical protein